jgi:hypothetical protein
MKAAMAVMGQKRGMKSRERPYCLPASREGGLGAGLVVLRCQIRWKHKHQPDLVTELFYE